MREIKSIIIVDHTKTKDEELYILREDNEDVRGLRFGIIKSLCAGEYDKSMRQMKALEVIKKNDSKTID